MQTETPQEGFWRGGFGDQYTERNVVDFASRKPFFNMILDKCKDIQSVCEFGANRGHNLLAINEINGKVELTGIEINEKACKELAQHNVINVINQSLLDMKPERTYDFVFTSGVLIHLAPEKLLHVYDLIFNTASKYILINEYFNPTPVEIEYRGHSQKLFKRDFAKEFLERYPESLEVLDYGFLWSHKEPAFDNTTWFLFQKK